MFENGDDHPPFVIKRISTQLLVGTYSHQSIQPNPIQYQFVVFFFFPDPM